MSRTFPTRSGAAQAARKELGDGKFFRTTPTEDGDWKWHYEPGDNAGAEWAKARDYIAWVETAWSRPPEGEPVKLVVFIVTCRQEELPEVEGGAFPGDNYLVEPVTPELWEDPNKPQPKARSSSTGERARSDVESPTKLVWQIADEMVGAERAAVVAACVERGVHKSTASTQYYRWKQARGS